MNLNRNQLHTPDTDLGFLERNESRYKNNMSSSQAFDLSSKESSYDYNTEIISNERLIKKLINDKQKLKEALSESATKRDELYKATIEFKKSRDEACFKYKLYEEKLKNFDFESQQTIVDLKSTKTELNILRERYSILEAKLIDRDYNFNSSSAQSNAKSQLETSLSYSIDRTIMRKMLNKAEKLGKLISLKMVVRNLYEECFQNSSNISDLVKDCKLDEVILRIFKFIEKLIKYSIINQPNPDHIETSILPNHQKKRTPTFSFVNSAKSSFHDTSPTSSESKLSIGKQIQLFKTDDLSIMKSSPCNIDTLVEHSSRLDQLSVQIQDNLNSTKLVLSQSFRLPSPEAYSQSMRNTLLKVRSLEKLNKSRDKEIKIETIKRSPKEPTNKQGTMTNKSKLVSHHTIKVERSAFKNAIASNHSKMLKTKK